jgi:hypothetical protein
VGAHKFAEGVTQAEGNEIYVIDHTIDTSVNNAEKEYNNYVNKVTAIGGSSKHLSGLNYEMQVNGSKTTYGVALRVNKMNLFVVAPAAYKTEINAFFKSLGYKL